MIQSGSTPVKHIIPTSSAAFSSVISSVMEKSPRDKMKKTNLCLSQAFPSTYSSAAHKINPRTHSSQQNKKAVLAYFKSYALVL